MAGRKKIKRFVIDVNSYITIFLNQETDWLQHYLVQNNIEVFIDHNLLAQLDRVLGYKKIKNALIFEKKFYISLVILISTQIRSNEIAINSPDPEDNYLYAIALTAHAKLLVTGEKALLRWKDTPVETISLSTFKQLF
jgi:putative PIN family toxin of toxin-antitoxin system